MGQLNSNLGLDQNKNELIKQIFHAIISKSELNEKSPKLKRFAGTLWNNNKELKIEHIKN